MKRSLAGTLTLLALTLAPVHADTVPRAEVKTGMPGQILEYGCEYTLTHATRWFELTITDTTGSYTIEATADTLPLLIEAGIKNGVPTYNVQPLPPASGAGLGFSKAIRLMQPTVVTMSWVLAESCSLTIH